MMPGGVLKITRGTKVIFVITITVSLLAIAFAYFYYRNINRSEDPRTITARNLLLEYDRISGSLDLHRKFRLLDSVQNIYNSLADYRNSFETGVIHNNRCGSLLMAAIYDSTMTDAEKTSCLDLALDYCDSSIIIYSNWKDEWGLLPEKEIAHKLKSLMKSDDPSLIKAGFERVVKRRTKNIVLSQVETDRRLSVSLTNMGTIMRHMLQQDSALYYNRKALDLWPENRTAKSNLSVLLGGEPVKPSIIEALFPPDKNKRD